MHFLENSMFVLNMYFCRELRFVAILRSKLRFLLRNTEVDSEFLRKKLAAEGSGCHTILSTLDETGQSWQTRASCSNVREPQQINRGQVMI